MDATVVLQLLLLLLLTLPIPIAPATTPVLAVVVVMLPLSAFIHACPAIHWAAPICAHQPSFVLVPLFVHLSCHLFGRPPFVLTDLHSCLLLVPPFVWAVPIHSTAVVPGCPHSFAPLGRAGHTSLALVCTCSCSSALICLHNRVLGTFGFHSHSFVHTCVCLFCIHPALIRTRSCISCLFTPVLHPFMGSFAFVWGSFGFCLHLFIHFVHVRVCVLCLFALVCIWLGSFVCTKYTVSTN